MQAERYVISSLQSSVYCVVFLFFLTFTFLHQIWGTDHMHRIVSEQSATVLYYTLMDQLLLIWVLQPAVGVARFYTTSTTKDNSFPDQVKFFSFLVFFLFGLSISTK